MARRPLLQDEMSIHSCTGEDFLYVSSRAGRAAALPPAYTFGPASGARTPATASAPTETRGPHLRRVGRQGRDGHAALLRAGLEASTASGGLTISGPRLGRRGR